MRILQFGNNGQVANSLKTAAKAHPRLSLQIVSRQEVDFSNPDHVYRTVLASDADMVVNAVAFTAVDKAESEPELVFRINCESVGALATACDKRRRPLIHISTDYVFNGEKNGPYLETDETNPINVYGRSKLAGEHAVKSALQEHIIIRTSWVYGSHGNNFVKTMLRLGAEKDVLRIINDQIGAPTAAPDIASTILSIIEMYDSLDSQRCHGVFHYTGGGHTNWFDFASAIFAEGEKWCTLKAQLLPVSTEEYQSPTRRPKNSTMDCSKMQHVFGIAPIPWKAALHRELGILRQEKE